MDTFTNAILPVVLAYATMRLKDPDDRADAVTQAWFAWTTARNPDLPPTVWARAGVRRVLSGRDMPGCGTRAKDALHRAVQGGDMEETRDWCPGPDEIVAEREAYTLMRGAMNDQQRRMADLFEQGARNQEVAADLHRTPARISQMRGEMKDRYDGLTG